MKILPVLALLGISLLVACGGGGGGGGGGPSTPAGPVVSTYTFSLRATYVLLVANGYSKTFTVSGTCAGSGSRTAEPATAATFEGKAGFSAVGTLTMTLVGCTPASQVQSYTGYYDNNFNPTGVDSPGINYGVYQTPLVFPLSVTVGSTGLLRSMSLYTSSTKATSAGRIDQSYVVEADTATSAIVNLISKQYNAAGTLIVTEQDRYRITPAITLASPGKLTPTSIDIDNANGTHLVLTF